MNLNEMEKAYQKQLQAEVEIPTAVTDKVQAVYRKIEQHEVTQEKVKKDAAYWVKKGAKIAGGMAAVLVAGFVVCVANPVMAKELPVVGGLFAELQDKVSFFGDFANRATPLVEATETGSDGAADAGEADSADGTTTGTDGSTDESAYTVKQNGLEISFSEVYANDQAVYLTMTAKSDEPFPDTMISQGELSSHPLINMDPMTASFSFLDGYQDWNVGNEGYFLDENTYACILRVDLASALVDRSEYNVQYEQMCQDVLDEMGVSQDDLNDETDEGYALLTEFNDKVSARAGALDVYKKEISLPDNFNIHLDIQQFIGYKAEPQEWDSGYTDEERAAMSDEELQALFDQMPAEYNQSPNQYYNWWFDGPWTFDIPVTVDRSQTYTMEINETNDAGIGLKSVVKTPYELTVNELYEDGGDSDSFMVALDANGNLLPSNESNGSCNNFTIQDRDISTVDIYILDYVQYMDELKGEERFNNNENKPEAEKWSTLLAANAKYHKTIHF